MADDKTTTELRNAKSVYSVIDEQTGDCVITIVRWNNGLYSRQNRETLKGHKRLKQNAEDALILLANATQPVALTDL